METFLVGGLDYGGGDLQADYGPVPSPKRASSITQCSEGYGASKDPLLEATELGKNSAAVVFLQHNSWTTGFAIQHHLSGVSEKWLPL